MAHVLCGPLKAFVQKWFDTQGAQQRLATIMPIKRQNIPRALLPRGQGPLGSAHLHGLAEKRVGQMIPDEKR